MTYDSNFQSADTYQNSQGMLFRVTPRYRLTDKLTVIASAGVTQRFTQEDRSDLANTTIALSRTPFRVGPGDMRVTSSVVLPTNQIQRDKESLQGAGRLGINYFIRTNTNFIWEMGGFATLNSHRYSVSAYDQANIQWRVSPYANIGWTFKDKWQPMLYVAYDRAWTYRNTPREFFTLDESLTYIGGRVWSATIGHTNAGSIVSKDGQSSNVAFFDSRTSVVYINGTFNY